MIIDDDDDGDHDNDDDDDDGDHDNDDDDDGDYAQTTSTRRLYRNGCDIQEDPENMMTNSNEDGVDKVLASRGTYVYIMESTSIDYRVQQTT